MRTVTLTCAECGTSFRIPKKEHTRQVKKGRTCFFCSLSCAAVKGNRPRRAKIEDRTCDFCGKTFQVLMRRGYKDTAHCSRSCASANSVTDRRQRASKMSTGNIDNLLPLHEVMKLREAPKYALIKKELATLGEPYEFEFPLGSYIFDLAFPNKLLLVEFDGAYHAVPKQQEADAIKTASATTLGWRVLRVQTDDKVLPVTALTQVVTLL